WYEHHRLGWNYRLTEFQAALLIAQLERLQEQTARRRRNAEYLSARRRHVPGIHPLSIPPYATGHSWHLYVLRFDAEVFGISREMFLRALVAEGIPASTGYAHSLYRNPMFLDPALAVNYSRYVDLCPVSEKACN